MGNRYAEISDITALGKSFTNSQLIAVENLLDTASSKLRIIAAKNGRNIDDMINHELLGNDYRNAVKSIVIQSVLRAVDSMESVPSTVSQGSQSALGYSISMTYLNAGQNLYFLKNELKELGIIHQTYGAVEVYSNADD